MQQTIIDAQKPPNLFNFRELYTYRELLLILAYREYKVRYSQTVLGFMWVFIQPFTTLLILVLVFGFAAKIDTGGVPYPLFVVTGLAAWNYASFVLSQAGSSIIQGQSLISKVYFPRLVIPLSKAIVGLIDLAVVLLFIVLLLIYYKLFPAAVEVTKVGFDKVLTSQSGSYPSMNIIYFPLFLLMDILIAVGIGIWMSALTIRFRDLQYTIPFLVQIGLYATPIAYPASILPEKIQQCIYLNPMVGVVEGFRWSILGIGELNTYMFLSFGMGLIIFITSLMYFKKVEVIMADIV